MNVQYIIDKSINSQIRDLHKRGGNFQKAAERLKSVVFDIKSGETSPFKSLKVTNHGESRIKHAVKYDLSGFARLITIQTNGQVVLVFVGGHDECEKWLNANRGLNIGVQGKSGELKDVFKSNNIADPQERVAHESDYSEGTLADKLGDHYLDKIFDNVTLKRSEIRDLEKLDSVSDEDDILEICGKIEDEKGQELIFDVFMELRHGSVETAKNRVLEFIDEITLLENLIEDKKLEIKSNDQYLRFDDLEEEDLKILMDNKSWYDWMLFMHPSQKAVVDRDFSGPARLLGVSGSGKTCVIVRRAVRLANKYPGERILILTLNRSLAILIKNLVEVLTDGRSNQDELISQIKVSSYWELCKGFILKYDDHEFKARIYNDFTDKQDDSIEEIWGDFYKCENNVNEASKLLPIHNSLISRGIFPQDYIKQEFDWVRSALHESKISDYLTIDREGRCIPFGEDYRRSIIEVLAAWNKIMPESGTIDYLGISQKALQLKDKITDSYRCILVDEFQDFGTIELEMIRSLAPQNENDLFLCGDIAQIVHTKHHKIRNAGIFIQPDNYLNIEKNYRNSREILSAAYDVFSKNINEESYQLDDFKILKPEYANFSSPKPFLRASSSLEKGFNSALKYLNDILDQEKGEKGCIAICGYSYYDIDKIGKEHTIPVLNGLIDLSVGNIYLSDLENTKGFEFDRMIILNCNEGAIPDLDSPEDEWFRDISKLYIAMTRAKKELIISYNDELSSLFKQSEKHFTRDNWVDHLDMNQIPKFSITEPTEDISSSSFRELNGREFLYTKYAVGLSVGLQDKLDAIVTGKQGLDEKNRPTEFRNMGSLISSLRSKTRDNAHFTRLFGAERMKELEAYFL